MPDAPLLLTPGPLSTPTAVREAMGVDYGSRDGRFVALVGRVRRQLVELVADPADYACVLMQGSGTFSVEAAIGTLVPRDGHVLVLINGAYGRRMEEICRVLGRRHRSLVCAEHRPVCLHSLERVLTRHRDITHVLAVHCETTTGLLNPIEAIAEIVARQGRQLIIDAMSAFGALPLNAATTPFEAVVASSNKCLEGAPGVGFVVGRRDALEAARGNAHSLSLDLSDQLARFDRDGQWRFTPPTHVMAALDAALTVHRDEGGVEGRGARYRANCARLVEGMRARGFRTLLPDPLQAPIIVTFHQPEDPSFSFDVFYDALYARGFAIYPGKLTEVETFRVGCIGQVYEADVARFLEAVDAAMAALS
ncbi:MAG: 2-aminoethylphosphonate--pyruvate transaminase [Alphaproteobacteria bacterium]|nr:2-aminoethylphosphonate--pyruvate transaminase [Alphaproteobacteria bacterium]